jgi:hypothetical protein
MEGFSDVFWEGDRIVWENLLRHYIVCLECAFSLAIIGGKEHRTTWDQIPVVNFGEHSTFTPEHRAMHNAIFDDFFAEPAVFEFVDSLVNMARPIRRRELALHLACVNYFALITIREVYQRRNLAPALASDETKKSAALAMLRHSVNIATQLKVLKSAQPVGEEKIDMLFSFAGIMFEQMTFIDFYNEQTDPINAATNFLAYNFSDGYVKEIERILYPDWYVACFMENCSSSSIWGTYGREHKGVCLRFKTIKGDSGHSMTLNRICGENIDGPVRSNVSTMFEKISYTSDLGSIDFFASIGRLPHPVLNKYWYTNTKGERSTSAAAMDRSIGDWCKSYWNNFSIRSTRKLCDWDREAEQRIVIYSNSMDISLPEARKAIYRFEDLDGIIFGIRTPLEDKLKICRIIEDKCRVANRNDFKFFQAYYSRSDGEIKYHELGLLKLKY